MPSKIEVDKIIREILKITLNVTEGQNGTPRLDNATNQILQAIYQAIEEGLLPKKEFYLIAENPKYTKEQLRELQPYCEGYNQARQEDKQFLAKMFGREK